MGWYFFVPAGDAGMLLVRVRALTLIVCLLTGWFWHSIFVRLEGRSEGLLSWPVRGMEGSSGGNVGGHKLGGTSHPEQSVHRFRAAQGYHLSSSDENVAKIPSWDVGIGDDRLDLYLTAVPAIAPKMSPPLLFSWGANEDAACGHSTLGNLLTPRVVEAGRRHLAFVAHSTLSPGILLNESYH